MENINILEKIEQADMVLVGLGESFHKNKEVLKHPKYISGCEILKEAESHWLIPAWTEFCAEKLGYNETKSALEKLTYILKDKNYFVVSVSTDSAIAENNWKHSRFVMPCGSALKKQCAKGCKDVLHDVTAEEKELLRAFFEEIYNEKFQNHSLGHCPVCGSPLILNNIYAENYNENGYLQQWQLYMKWLQGTLNRRLLIIELGVGMKYPTVIRWPFEKTAYFNQKAYFCRVNENLYQMTEELAGKGCGIPMNAIDWIHSLEINY